MSSLLGVCAPTLGDEYGHDLAENPRFPTWPCRFDPMAAYRPLAAARRLGARWVRMFACEGGEGVRLTDDGAIDGVSERLLESVKIVHEGARLHGLYLGWSVLDAGSVADGDPVTRRILEDPASTEAFADRVLRPLARAIDPSSTVAVDVVRNPERVADELGWERLGAAIATMGDAIRGEAPLLVTAGVGRAHLGDLLRASPRLDAVDVDVLEGEAPPARAALARQADDAWVERAPLILGRLEVGSPDALDAALDALDPACAAACVWQLSALIDERGAPNATGARFASR